MKTLKQKDFLAWADEREIKLDERYPDSAVLTFEPDLNQDRFWIIPAESEKRPYFIASILEELGEWKSCFVWRHMGSWNDIVDPSRVNDNIELEILKGLKIPLGTADILEFSKSEINALITLIFSTSIFGWSVNEDLYIISDNAKFIVQTDHHGVIHVSFKDAKDMKQFIKNMSENGFPLPNDVPDATFKYPDWMK